MSLFGLLTRGIDSVLSEPDSEAELQELLAKNHIDADAAMHVVETLRAMPALLVAIQRSLSRPETPVSARSLFVATVQYLILDDNLIPSHAGKPMYGLLDDVYLLHAAAYEMRDSLGSVDIRSVAGGMHLLESLLPMDVIRQLQVVVRTSAEIS